MHVLLEKMEVVALEFACSFDSVQMKRSSHTAAAATTYDR
jgi:hypothetical protein